MLNPGASTWTMAGLIAVAVILAAALAWAVRRVRVWKARADVAESQQGDLVRNLGHEIASPLNAILAGTDLVLKAGDLPSEARQYVEIMRGAVRELQLASFNLLALHAGSQAGIVGERSTIVLPELLDRVVANLQPLLDPSRVTLNAHYEFGGPYQVEVEEYALRFLITNVIAHSIRLTSSGHIDVTLHAPVGGREAGVQITVADTADTVPEKLRESLFSPYGQGVQLERGRRGRTGLNLHVARNLARKLGGDVVHHAHPHAGNLFEVAVLATVLSANVTAATARDRQVVVPFNDIFATHRRIVSPQLVLVTEDQRSNSHLIGSILKRAGHSVHIAATGEEALQRLQEHRYNLAIMDLRLPEMSGLSVMQTYQAAPSHDHHRVTFIVLTGEFTESTRQACVSAGAQAFLVKPVSAPRLLEAIESAMARRRSDEASPRNGWSDGTQRSNLTPRMAMEYLHDALDYVDELREALAARDGEVIRQRCRALSGVAHLLSAYGLAGTCRLMIAASEDELFEHRRDWIERLDKGLQAAEGGSEYPED